MALTDRAPHTFTRNGKPITVHVPRGYRYDPGPGVTVSYHTTPTAWPREVVTCPRCGNPCAQEPAFSHCVMCGRLYPIAGANLNAQREWELFEPYAST